VRGDARGISPFPEELHRLERDAARFPGQQHAERASALDYWCVRLIADVDRPFRDLPVDFGLAERVARPRHPAAEKGSQGLQRQERRLSILSCAKTDRSGYDRRPV